MNSCPPMHGALSAVAAIAGDMKKVCACPSRRDKSVRKFGQLASVSRVSWTVRTSMLKYRTSHAMASSLSPVSPLMFTVAARRSVLAAVPMVSAKMPP